MVSVRDDCICCAHGGSVSLVWHLPHPVAVCACSQTLLIVDIMPSFSFSFLLLNFPFHEGKSVSVKDVEKVLKQAEDPKVIPFLSCPVPFTLLP